jgi:hypothetical protein
MRMWRANESDRPCIPEGDLDPVTYKLLWDKVEVNPVKRNAEKEMLRASESIEKKSFIINEIAKYSIGGLAWQGMLGMPRKCHASLITGSKSIERSLVRCPSNPTSCRKGSGRSRIGGETTLRVVPRRTALRTSRT